MKGKYRGLKSRRRNYFIKRGFQVKFILQFLSVLILATIVMGTLLYFTINARVEDQMFRSHVSIETAADIVLPILFYINLIVLLITLVIAIILTLFVSHKIAGPFYRYQKSAELVGKGDLSAFITLRTKDQTTELADAFNSMLLNLKEKISPIKKETSEIKALLGRIMEIIDQEPFPKDKVKEFTSSLIHTHRRLKDTFSVFQL